jgi:hypothetical protein
MTEMVTPIREMPLIENEPESNDQSQGLPTGNKDNEY